MEEEDSANGGDLGLEVLVEGAPVKSADCAGSEEEGTVSESSVVKQSRAEILLGTHTHTHTHTHCSCN